MAMRSKDIHIGERYIARHRGTTITVTIVEIKQVPPPSWAAGNSWRTIVHATNDANGKPIVFRTPLRIMRKAGPYIAAVKSLEDLCDDEIAVSEPGVRYRLRRIDEPDFFAEVDYVIRRSTGIYARTNDNKEFPITGDGACVLVPIGS